MSAKPRKKKQKFSLAYYRKDKRIVELVKETDKKTLAIWARDCAERVLPYFQEEYPDDYRPQKAIETLKTWIKTGAFKIAAIRRASLDAHAAARQVGKDSAARSAARAAGQAVATAHVPTHSIGSAIYALQAVHRATNTANTQIATAEEREWQYQHLLKLKKDSVESR